MAGLSEIAGLVGGLGTAGLAAGLQPASNTATSSAGPFQGGSLTIGAKQVGGKGNSAGATTSSQAQTPISESPGVTASTAGSGAGIGGGGGSGGAVIGQSSTLIVIAGAVAVVAILFAMLGGRKR